MRQHAVLATGQGEISDFAKTTHLELVQLQVPSEHQRCSEQQKLHCAAELRVRKIALRFFGANREAIDPLFQLLLKK
eukprot:NODE_7215_length_581_cov_3.825188_g6211_i0.p2 GENE.NODE_7215_length_581_cov_3.825188_g6211_i0~~NODE_7215_length_581_cov_3.825188_g6211_i0.p2  ORF type:complete len:77 (-),score=9.29 NODE_7215_length_581_cov_3.825188_g6211_i0:185-415(-)